MPLPTTEHTKSTKEEQAGNRSSFLPAFPGWCCQLLIVSLCSSYPPWLEWFYFVSVLSKPSATFP